MFVSRVVNVLIAIDSSFRVSCHYFDDDKTVLHCFNNTADISGDVLYEGKINDCLYRLLFDTFFYYP